ncbi:hypothetical protein [Alkalilimnicola ehrlichii]|nr:hypothetical protein [Alkalilimnicola ehrlichii]
MSKRRSVARAITLKIAPSPLNPVKLEFGFWLVVCIGAFLLLAGLDTSRSLDTAILAVVASVGTLRIVWRAHRVMRVERERAEHGEESSHGPK